MKWLYFTNLVSTMGYPIISLGKSWITGVIFTSSFCVRNNMCTVFAKYDRLSISMNPKSFFYAYFGTLFVSPMNYSKDPYTRDCHTWNSPSRDVLFKSPRQDPRSR